MNTFKTYCTRKFPQNWEVAEKQEGVFYFRDNLISRGAGYAVKVEELTARFQVSLIFEDFARKLSDYAERRIADPANPLRNLFERNPFLEVNIRKHIVEKNFNADTGKVETWDFELVYTKSSDKNEADRFSDLLISIILYLFPYQMEPEVEGAQNFREQSGYERSHLNRSLCLAYHGYNCSACDVNLKEMYGDIARDFIHVHHLNPIAHSGIIIPDPIRDFVPLCPNCHAVAHLRNPPLTIEEIRLNLKSNGKTDIK